MSDPAIRAALDSARDVLVESGNLIGEREVAAAVAAFLRELHQMTPLGVIETRGGETYTADCDRLASAVEEASNA